MVGLDSVFCGSQKESGSFFIVSSVLFDVVTDLLQVCVDDVHRDGAMVDIDEAGAAVDLQKADGEVFLRFPSRVEHDPGSDCSCIDSPSRRLLIDMHRPGVPCCEVT